MISRNDIIVILIGTLTLAAAFEANAYIFEHLRFYIVLNNIYLFAFFWNALFPFIAGFVLIKFVDASNNIYPWLFILIPIFNIGVLGTLIGDIEQNIKTLQTGYVTIIIFTLVQIVFIFAGAKNGYSGIKK